jgi:rod shape-determining protein MreB and related proteins
MSTASPEKKKRTGSLWSQMLQMVSNDIGIDLGTANTLVYVRGRGIVINEPSIVAVNQKTGQVVAVGQQAKDMLGRTPQHISAVKPVVDGVISDFEVTEEMLAYLISKAQQGNSRMLGPRVVIGVPSGVSSVEIRAVRDAARNAGAREVHVMEEPMAAAIGIGLPVKGPTGSMIVDIGGGTTDIGVVSLGGIVHSRHVLIAGDKFNTDIITFIRNEFKILIGEKSAEQVKLDVGSVLKTNTLLRAAVRGRDLVSGLPREILVTSEDVRRALQLSIEALVESIKEVLETTPPEVVSDVMQHGIYLAGGGAMLRGFSELLVEQFGIPVHVAEDPLSAVVRGTAIVLEDIEGYKEALVPPEDELAPTE